MHKPHKAFTLVELIVVIVILSILSTIAFLSFNSYSSSTRDSVRLSDISSIAKGLTLQYSIGGYYILPDNNVSLLSGSTIIGYQGKAGTNTINTIKISSNGGRDPLDNTYYTYNTNLTRNKYQLSGFLEGKGSVINRVGYEDYNIENNNPPDSLSFVFPLNKGDLRGIDDGNSVILSLSKNPFLSLLGDFTSRNNNLLSSSFGAEGNGVEGIYENNSSSFSLLSNVFNGLIDISTTLRSAQYDDNGSFINETNATIYTNRYPYTKGDSIGVILSSTGGTGSIIYTPLEDSGTGIDISSGTLTNGKILISNNVDSSTGVSVGSMSGYVSSSTVITNNNSVFSICTAVGQIYTGSTTYSGCDTPDKIICTGVGIGQVWPMCNVGATTSIGRNTVPAQSPGDGTATLPTNRVQSVQGNYYQWGRNDDVTLVGSPTSTLAPTNTLANTVGHTNFINAPSTPYDWITSPQNDNLWGGTTTTSTDGYYSNQSTANQTLMQGPCSSGYHVPTMKEWCDLTVSVNPTVTCTSAWQPDTSVIATLKLSLAGHRNFSDATYYFQSTYGTYRTSSPNSTLGYDLRISSSHICPLNYLNRSYGFSVRCLKN